jgi:hypothetical protein
MDANQAKADSTVKEIRASQEHPKEEMLAKMEAKTDANQEKMDDCIAELRTWREETMACQKRWRPVWKVRRKPHWRQSPMQSMKKPQRKRPQWNCLGH